MRAISTEGFADPKTHFRGMVPKLRWLRLVDLVVDPTYRRPIEGKGRQIVSRIAQSFSWSCFTPVVVAPVAEDKFAIIDGQYRATAAALVGFENVPCQIVMATQEEQAAAFRAINRLAVRASRMSLQAAALGASDPSAVRLADICARADVEPLRYPVPVERQVAGQTMAVGAITQCLKRFGEETLITALQCVTQTTNNKPGMLSARMIKALCEVLDSDQERRDNGLALFEAFDAIDLTRLQNAASIDAAAKKIALAHVISGYIRSELIRLLPAKAAVRVSLRASSTTHGRRKAV
jgi:hypothetical protein